MSRAHPNMKSIVTGMETPIQDNLQEVEKQARKRVKELRSFYTHLFLFLLINLFLTALSVLTSPNYFWAIWPILGWGLGLCAHALSVFGLFGIGSKSWEERKVQEFMLAQQRGLSASQVRTLLQEELDEVATSNPAELHRVIERIENIEAIVTSQAWDILQEEGEAKGQELLSDEEMGGVLSDTEKAKRLARRVR